MFVVAALAAGAGRKASMRPFGPAPCLQAPPSPYDTAFSEGSGSISVLSGSSPITSPLHLRKRTRSQGPLLRQRYPASTLLRPCPTPVLAAACRDVEAATLHHNGSPPIARTTFPTCRAYYPGGSSGCRCRLLPRAHTAFPKWQEGRHPHCHFRGLLRLHSRYGPPDRSAAHRRPLSRGSSPRGCPREPLVSYRINRQLSGWIPPPLMIHAVGAHCQYLTCGGGVRSTRLRCQQFLAAEFGCQLLLLPPTSQLASFLLNTDQRIHRTDGFSTAGFRSRGQLCLQERGAVVLAVTFVLVVLRRDEALD